MERLEQPRPAGISGGALYRWGMVFLALGTVSRGLIQNNLLRLGQLTPAALLEAMQSSQTVMTYATIALILGAMETCAVPIFAFLLVEGVQHTSNLRNYFTRVLGLAVVTEIPYTLAMSGKLLNGPERNPVFGLALGLIMLYFYLRYPEKSVKHVLIRVIVTVSAALWCVMLKVAYGEGLILITAVLWAFRRKPMLRNLAGATVSLLCSVTSLLYIAAPMGFLAVHFYNGEREDQEKLPRYLAYPVILLVVYAAGRFLPKG